MSRLPLLSTVAGLALVVVLCAPAVPERINGCVSALNTNPLSLADQASPSGEYIETLVRRVQAFDVGAALRPWRTCAAEIADSVTDGVAVAWAALERQGVALEGNGLLGQAVTLVQSVREAHGTAAGKIELTQAGGIGNGDARGATLTWTVLRTDVGAR